MRPLEDAREECGGSVLGAVALEQREPDLPHAVSAVEEAMFERRDATRRTPIAYRDEERGVGVLVERVVPRVQHHGDITVWRRHPVRIAAVQQVRQPHEPMHVGARARVDPLDGQHQV